MQKTDLSLSIVLKIKLIYFCSKKSEKSGYFFKYLTLEQAVEDLKHEIPSNLRLTHKQDQFNRILRTSERLEHMTLVYKARTVKTWIRYCFVPLLFGFFYYLAVTDERYVSLIDHLLN